MTAPFDFKNPDYIAEYQRRLDMLQRLRDDPTLLPGLRAWYRDHPADFINDWGMTFDPRNADIGRPTVFPFVLFPKQREWIEWAFNLWKTRRSGVTPKSREVGVSWLSVSLASTICLFNDEVVIGFGSRKAEYVDKLGAPKSLFWKARQFIKRLPEEFRVGWDEKLHSVEMRISFPGTGSVLAGEAGDGIGRGDRASMYLVDEAAHLERPMLVEASLSATTNCRIDISSANGTDNPFYDKVVKYPRDQVFTIHWRDDPRKDDAWYALQCDRLDPVTVAQEIDINFSASKTGILIPSEWVAAAIDVDKTLGLIMRGDRRAAMDVADEGVDKNAFGYRHGVKVMDVMSLSGKGSDIFSSVQKMFMYCDEHGISGFDYDADGLGAGVRGDAIVINKARRDAGVHVLAVGAFRGSGKVFAPEKPIPTAATGGAPTMRDRKNEDFFMNAKAQAWWDLRVRFQRTHRAVTAHKLGQAHEYKTDDLICLSGGIKELTALTMELSQPTYSISTAGKIMVDKTPDGSRSPNLADDVMMLFAPRRANFLANVD